MDPTQQSKCDNSYILEYTIFLAGWSSPTRFFLIRSTAFLLHLLFPPVKIPSAHQDPTLIVNGNSLLRSI